MILCMISVIYNKTSHPWTLNWKSVGKEVGFYMDYGNDKGLSVTFKQIYQWHLSKSRGGIYVSMGSWVDDYGKVGISNNSMNM